MSETPATLETPPTKKRFSWTKVLVWGAALLLLGVVALKLVGDSIGRPVDTEAPGPAPARVLFPAHETGAAPGQRCAMGFRHVLVG